MATRADDPALDVPDHDHRRVMDGAEAGRALEDLRRLLESPFKLGAHAREPLPAGGGHVPARPGKPPRACRRDPVAPAGTGDEDVGVSRPDPLNELQNRLHRR